MAIYAKRTIDNENVKVSYPYCGQLKEIEFDAKNLKKVVSKIGDAYPDIESQVAHLAESIEERKAIQLTAIAELLDVFGINLIYNQLNAIDNYLVAMKDLYCNSDGGELICGLTNDIYAYTELIRKLIDIYLADRGIDKSIKGLKYAQEGILL